jgi:hypothetical protein
MNVSCSKRINIHTIKFIKAARDTDNTDGTGAVIQTSLLPMFPTYLNEARGIFGFRRGKL